MIFFSLSKALSNGWLVINWSKFFYDIGYTSIDYQYPINVRNFIEQILFKDTFTRKDD